MGHPRVHGCVSWVRRLLGWSAPDEPDRCRHVFAALKARCEKVVGHRGLHAARHILWKDDDER